MRTDTPIERFAQKFEVKGLTECWPWHSYLNRMGYGHFWSDGRNQLAHRLMWEFENGSIPDRLCVLHTCDNRVCVNPNHLFLGTQRDNIQDKHTKGRAADQCGEHNNSAKLTADQVRQIRG